MMNQRQYDNLAKLYKFLSKESSSTKTLGASMSTFINSQNNLIPNLHQIVDPIEFVKALIAYREEINSVIVKYFYNDPHLQKEKENAFQSMINAHQKAPFFLAVYSDHLFRKSKALLCRPLLN